MGPAPCPRPDGGRPCRVADTGVGPFPEGRDPEEYDRLRRRVLWSLPTGLFVVGSRAGARRNLMTCNWVMQVATTPKLVAVAVGARIGDPAAHRGGWRVFGQRAAPVGPGGGPAVREAGRLGGVGRVGGGRRHAGRAGARGGRGTALSGRGPVVAGLRGAPPPAVGRRRSRTGRPVTCCSSGRWSTPARPPPVMGPARPGTGGEDEGQGACSVWRTPG